MSSHREQPSAGSSVEPRRCCEHCQARTVPASTWLRLTSSGCDMDMATAASCSREMGPCSCHSTIHRGPQGRERHCDPARAGGRGPWLPVSSVVSLAGQGLRHCPSFWSTAETPTALHAEDASPCQPAENLPLVCVQPCMAYTRHVYNVCVQVLALAGNDTV